MVTFYKQDKVEQIVNKPSVEETMPIAYFEVNRLYEEAHEILYWDFPKHFTWQSYGKF
jgi:hypothetical protein